MQVRLVYGLIIAGLLISQTSIASPTFPLDKPISRCQNNTIDIPAQPFPSDSDSNFTGEEDNDPVEVYVC